MHPVATALAAALLCFAPRAAAVEGEFDGVAIGRQVWMARNLDVAAFRNGDPIAAVPDAEGWTRAGRDRTPAYAVYANDPANRVRWGLLYNHAAVADPRGLCPAGWRMPTDADWNELEATLGRERAALRMKSTDGWNGGGNGTDDVGFGGLPAGFRSQTGAYFLDGRVGYFWPADVDADGAVTAILLFDYDPAIFRIQYPLELGMSVRCLREAPPGARA